MSKQIPISNKCEILDSILNNKVLKKIIGIENPKSNSPSIRFIDTKTNDFKGCEIMHFLNNNILPVEGFVISEPTYSLNTGQFRDIVLFDFKVKNDTINLTLSAAYFENQAEKEGIPFFLFQLIHDEKGNLRVDKFNVRQVRESRPPVYYDTIKE